MKRLWPLLLLVSACDRSAAEAPPAAAAPAGPPQVEVVPVKSEMLHLTVALPGELTPYEAVAIYPRVTGFIEQIPVDRGSVVRKGALLAGSPPPSSPSSGPRPSLRAPASRPRSSGFAPRPPRPVSWPDTTSSWPRPPSAPRRRGCRR